MTKNLIKDRPVPREKEPPTKDTNRRRWGHQWYYSMIQGLSASVRPGEVVVCSHRKGRRRMFAVIPEGDLIELLETDRTRNTLGLFEIIVKDRRVKPYFDIDLYGEVADIEGGLKPFTDALTKQIPDAELAISGPPIRAGRPNKGPFKASWHVIVCNKFFDSQDALLRSGLKEWMSTNAALGVDARPYASNHQQLKCVGQAKANVAPKGKQDAQTHVKQYRKHTVTVFDGTEARMGTEFAACVGAVANAARSVNAARPCYRPIAKSTSQRPPPRVDIHHSDPDTLLHAIPPDLGRFRSSLIMRWYRGEGGSFAEFYRWGSAPYAIKSEEEKRLWTAKWESKETRRVSRGYIRELLTEIWPAFESTSVAAFHASFLKRFDPEFLRSTGVEVTITARKYDFYALSSGIAPAWLVESGKVCLLGHAMGWGKTHAVRHYIERRDAKRVLWITNRISLGRNLMKDLAALGFAFYKDIEPRELRRCGRIVCQVESMKQLNGIAFDVVVADEIESVFHCFASDVTHRSDPDTWFKNFEVFQHVLRTAPKLFLMDAFLSTRTTEFIANILPGETQHLLTDPGGHHSRNIVRYAHKGRWLGDIVNTLVAGEKVFVFYPYKTGGSKDSIEVFARKIVDRAAARGHVVAGHEVYHGDTDDETRKTLARVNKIWGKLQLVVVNSSIDVGVDCTIPWDRVFISYADHVLPRSVVQASHRIRNLRDTNIGFYYFKSHAVQRRPERIMSGCGHPVLTPLLKSLKIEIMAKGIESVLKFFDAAGYTITHDDQRTDGDMKPLKRKRDANPWAFESIPEITAEQEEFLRRKRDMQDATMIEKQMISKHHAMRVFDGDQCEYFFDNAKSYIEWFGPARDFGRSFPLNTIVTFDTEFRLIDTPLSTKDKERLFDTFTMDPSRRERYGDQKIRSKVVLSLFGHSLVEFEDHLRRIKGPKPSPPLDTIQTL